MNFKSTFLGTSLFLTSLGFGLNAEAKDKPFDKDAAATVAMMNDTTDVSGPTSYTIPKYAEYSNVKDEKKLGIYNKDYPNHQRYTYANVNAPGKYNHIGDVKLQNVVTAAVIKQDVHVTPGVKTEEAGGLYFNHGYSKFTVSDVVRPADQKNVDLDNIASQLIKNPTFELKMTGHADRSGDSARNQELSENRIQTGKDLLLAALQKQGLSAQEAKDLYEKRVAPNTTIIAEGETNGPVATQDGVREQGNRVVTFDLITQTAGQTTVNSTVKKGADFDNHEHIVVMNLGSSKRQEEIFFYPHDHGVTNVGQFSIPDENTSFVIKIDPDRKAPFTINNCPHSNLVADNTSFLIESDKPGAVTSAYNFKTGTIDVSVEGKVMIVINTLDRRIDPALIRVGQVDSQGHAVISPLTNLAEIAPISESRNAAKERNVLTDAADRIVHLSIDAKHLYMAHAGDQAGYQKALKEYGFAEKVEGALKDLDKAGIDTKAYKSFVVNSYSDPKASYYNPDQIVFPFQTYEGLYQSQPDQAKATTINTIDAYKKLLSTVEKGAETKPATPVQQAAMQPPAKPK